MTKKINLDSLEELLQSSGEHLPRLFAVVSWGATATAWLAKLLNAHPECFCTHHLNHAASLNTVNYDLSSDLDAMEAIARLGFHYRLAGDCHGISRDSIPQLIEKFGERFRACVLVRHPIPRVASSLKHAKTVGLEYYGLDYQSLKATLDKPLQQLLQTEEQLFFAHIMNLINAVELEANAQPIFLMEDITQDFNAFQKLIGYISADELSFNQSLYDHIAQKPLNQHSKLGNKQPETIFQQWPDWQREAFTVLLNPRAKEIYEQLGYDLSCIEREGFYWQKQLDRSHLGLRNTQAELERLQTQLQNMRVELERSRTQVQQTQGELEHSQSQVQQTQGELEHSQSQVQQTQGELEHFQSQVQQTQGELEHSQSQVQQTQAEVMRLQAEQNSCQAQVQLTQAELERSRIMIAVMESSKFWKLREVWLRVKRSIKLAGNETEPKETPHFSIYTGASAEVKELLTPVEQTETEPYRSPSTVQTRETSKF